MDLDHFFFLQLKQGKMRSPGKGKGEAPAAAKAEEEFQVEEVKDRIEGSLGSRLALVTRELGLNTAAAAKRRDQRLLPRLHHPPRQEVHLFSSFISSP